MLSLFRSLRPASFFAFLAYFGLLKTGILLSPPTEIIESSAPFTAVLLDLLKLLPPIITTIIPVILVFALSLILNKIVIQFKLMPESNFLTAVFVVLISSFHASFNVISEPLLCSIFIVLAMPKVFNLIKTDPADGLFFDIGLLVGIASLFYLPSIIFIFLMLFGIASLRTFNIREGSLVIAGLIVPYFLTGVALMMLNDFQVLTTHINTLTVGSLTAWTFELLDYLAFGALLLSLLISIISISAGKRNLVIEIKKYNSFMIGFLIFSLLPLLVASNTIASGFLIVFPLAIFVANWVAMQQKALFPELIHLAWIGLIFYVQYFTFVF